MGGLRWRGKLRGACAAAECADRACLPAAPEMLFGHLRNDSALGFVSSNLKFWPPPPRKPTLANARGSSSARGSCSLALRVQRGSLQCASPHPPCVHITCLTAHHSALCFSCTPHHACCATSTTPPPQISTHARPRPHQAHDLRLLCIHARATSRPVSHAPEFSRRLQGSLCNAHAPCWPHATQHQNPPDRSLV